MQPSEDDYNANRLCNANDKGQTRDVRLHVADIKGIHIESEVAYCFFGRLCEAVAKHYSLEGFYLIG